MTISPDLDRRFRDAALALDLEPLRTLARAAAGAVVVSETQLAATLAELWTRWRLWYRAPGRVDGGLHPLSVQLVRSGVEARAPGWSRSGTPRVLAEARLRRLFGPSPRLEGGLGASLAASFDRRLGALEIRAAASAESAAGLEGPLRLSVAFEVPEDSAFAHTVLALPASGGAWERRSSFPWPGEAPRATVLLEDLSRGLWVGAVARRAAAAE